MGYSPPFSVTAKALASIADIERILGSADTSGMVRPEPLLRRRNRISTVKDSLAIEGNTLSIEQATAIFDQQRVVGPKNEIIEVKNAIDAYAQAGQFQLQNEKHFLKAHGLLMAGLIRSAGKYRSGSVGIMKGSHVSHIAPQAKRVPELMHQLFAYASQRRIQPLILAAVMHYEIEFIHPFEDGNGRMGRLWQHVVLRQYHPLFEYAPFESVIRAKQKQYYRILEKCDRSGDCTAFVEFSLETLAIALRDQVVHFPQRRATYNERISAAREKFRKTWFSRGDYAGFFKQLSLPTASRDLATAVDDGLLKNRGKKNQTRYWFK
jgi:Fic family protein